MLFYLTFLFYLIIVAFFNNEKCPFEVLLGAIFIFNFVSFAPVVREDINSDYYYYKGGVKLLIE